MTDKRDDGEYQYEVGYKKPPMHTRFQPGNQAASTKDKARRRKAKTLDAILAKGLAKRIPVKRSDGSRVTMSALELIVTNMLAMARSTDPRQAFPAFKILREMSPHLPVEDAASRSIKIEFVTPPKLPPAANGLLVPWLDNPSQR